MIYIVIMAQADLNNGVLKFSTKPTTIEGCTYTFNSSSVMNSTTTPTNEDGEVDGGGGILFGKPIHHISYLYYTTTGALITIVVSLCATLVFGRQDTKDVPAELLAPFVRKFWKGDDAKANIASLPLSPSDASCITFNFDQEKLAAIETEEFKKDLN